VPSPRLPRLPSVRSPSSPSGYVCGTLPSVSSPTTGVSACAKLSRCGSIWHLWTTLHLRIRRSAGPAHPTPQPSPTPLPPCSRAPCPPGYSFLALFREQYGCRACVVAQRVGSMPLQAAAAYELEGHVCVHWGLLQGVEEPPSLPLCLNTPCAACVLTRKAALCAGAGGCLFVRTTGVHAFCVECGAK
jgi:hypothetical protein